MATGCVSSERRVGACKSRKFELVQIKFGGRVRVLQNFLVVVGVGGERKKISQDRFYLIFNNKKNNNNIIILTFSCGEAASTDDVCTKWCGLILPDLVLP